MKQTDMHSNDAVLIERSKLFGNPVQMGAQLSPDGCHISYIAPYEGVLNIWVAALDNLEQPRLITKESGRGIFGASWAYDGVHLLYAKDNNGDELFHLYAVNVISGASFDLTPVDGARISILATSKLPHLRGKVLIQIFKRDPRFGDLYTVDIATGEMQLVLENPGMAGFVVNEKFEVLFGRESMPDGSTVYSKLDAGEWVQWLTFAATDVHCSQVSHVDSALKKVYMFDSRGRDTGALVSVDFDAPDGNTAPVTVIVEDARADVAGVFTNSVTRSPMAATLNYERLELVVLDPALQGDVDFLEGQLEGDWSVTSRTEDDRAWIVADSTDRMPGTVYHFDRNTRALRKLYVSRPQLEDLPLARMQSTVIPTSDGFNMVCYLTLPTFADRRDQPLTASKPLPMVLLVHGGPWARDEYGFNSTHQWLANRGYAVLSVNFRGSTGFGKAFAAAGNLEWGAKMDDDLTTAVRWATDRGIADASRIAIMGGSYGGYAALWAATQHGDRYACAVDIVGPSNLETLLSSVPAYWEMFKAKLYAAIGDPRTDEGRRLLKERSPLSHANCIVKPLLIGQGANDPRVKQAESDQMVSAMEVRGIPFTYVLFPDEGHGFQRPANNIKFNIITEQFLAKHLGGRVQPEVDGECDGNTAIVKQLS